MHDWVADNCDRCDRCPPPPTPTNGCCVLRDAINRAWWDRCPVAEHIQQRIGQGAVCQERQSA